MHHRFDWPLTPFLSISLWGLAVTNQNPEQICEFNTLPGPFCSALGPEPPTPENAPIPTPFQLKKKTIGAFEGVW